MRFSHIDLLREALKSQADDELKSLIDKALNAARTREGLEKNLQCKTMMMPMSQHFKSAIDLYDKAITAAKEILEKYSGTDPYQMQEIVHRVLGISKTPLVDGLKESYLKIMEESGFLQVRERSVKVGALVAQLLGDRPEIEQLNLGCGDAGKDCIGSCHFRRENDHGSHAMTIDLYASIGPTIEVDMHDKEFWAAIPNDRLLKVSDHTYGRFLFEDQRSKETLSQIYRTLKTGGTLAMDHPFNDEHIPWLTEIGFVIDSPKIARKS
jgi:hypothetical protein